MMADTATVEYSSRPIVASTQDDYVEDDFLAEKSVFEEWYDVLCDLHDCLKKGSMRTPLHFITSSRVFFTFKKAAQAERIKRLEAVKIKREELEAERGSFQERLNSISRETDEESKALAEKYRDSITAINGEIANLPDKDGVMRDLDVDKMIFRGIRINEVKDTIIDNKVDKVQRDRIFMVVQ